MYQPEANLGDTKVYDELVRVAQELNKLPVLPVVYVEPQKPQIGTIVLADGVHWNPVGAGVLRPVWFNGTAWVAL
jgi:hypothetical protein